MIEDNIKKEDSMPSVRKVIISGTTLMISIPREVREIYGIEKGDRIEVHFVNKIYKREKVKKELYEETSGRKMVDKVKEEEVDLPEFE